MIASFRTGTDNIGNAVNYWVNTSSNPGVTTSISIRETSTKSSASFEFHGYYLGFDDGKTYHKYYDDDVNPSSANWGWVIIRINPDASRYAERAETGLVGHELGHAMGLSHQEADSRMKTSIMHPNPYRTMEDSATYRNRPATVDCNNINHIYG